MKIYHLCIIALCIASVMLVSGCCCCTIPSTGTPDLPDPSTGRDPTPVPTGTAGDDTPTFDMDRLKMYEYKFTNAINGETSVSYLREEDMDDTLNGVPVKRQTIIMKSDYGSGMQEIRIDTYYDRATGEFIKGKMTMPGGFEQEWTDSSEDYSGMGGIGVKPSDLISDVDLHNAGIDTVTVPLGTYVGAVRYTYVTPYGSSTMWYHPTVPLPLKIQYQVSAGGSTTVSTMELVAYQV